jgi:cell division protein FtsL
MYQYGNVAVQYQKEKDRKPNTNGNQNRQPQKNPVRLGISPREKIVYIFSIIIVVAVLSLLLMQMASVSQFNYEIQSLEKEITQIEERNSNLQLEVANLSAPERIIKLAQEEWGMSLNKSTVKILSNPSMSEEEKGKISVDE